MIGIISVASFFPFLVLAGDSVAATGGEDTDLIGS